MNRPQKSFVLRAQIIQLIAKTNFIFRQLNCPLEFKRRNFQPNGSFQNFRSESPTKKLRPSRSNYSTDSQDEFHFPTAQLSARIQTAKFSAERKFSEFPI